MQSKIWQHLLVKPKKWKDNGKCGHGLIVYSSQYFAILSPKRFKKLIESRTKAVTAENMKQKFRDALKEYLPQNKAEELLKKLNR
jgi:hypothetical protein